LWYGFLFACGFLLAYFVLFSLLKHETSHPRKVADQLTFYGVIGIIVGARLFDVIFYENWDQIANHPGSIIAVWRGGLASHGGVLGLIVALLFFQRRHRFCSFFHLLDLLILPASLAAFFIRVGNFINQEILGKPSDLPWAVIFGHPADGSPPIPRHPVQLYEALFYLFVFFLFSFLKKTWRRWREGKACGAFLMLIFGFRFCIEFLKEEQSYHLSHSLLTMGQWLSIPLFLVGLHLFFRKKG
jgi:prolipoprotein diacylglyceryl transferase